MLFNVENWNISSLVFGLILATGLAVYAVYTLVTSKKHLREMIDDDRSNFVDGYIIQYRECRFVLILAAAYFIAVFAKALIIA